MPKLILIRGLPGCGASTLALREYASQGYVHLETDQFFTKNGRYAYDPNKREEAEKWCRDQVYQALLAGRNVVVSNYFIRKRAVVPYRALAKVLKADLEIIVLRTQFESRHLKNKARFEAIKALWEEDV